MSHCFCKFSLNVLHSSQLRCMQYCQQFASNIYSIKHTPQDTTWWRHQMETFSALLSLCVGNSPFTSEFSTQRPMMQNFDVLFDLRLNKQLSKQLWYWWFEMPSHSLWCHCNELGGRHRFPIKHWYIRQVHMITRGTWQMKDAVYAIWGNYTQSWITYTTGNGRTQEH